uniref:Uncharacterized protein n=1 Tax=viral metagenome TaxID=1070528 RepID=A0A6C0BPL5_9ZZZZ
MNSCFTNKHKDTKGIMSIYQDIQKDFWFFTLLVFYTFDYLHCRFLF